MSKKHPNISRIPEERRSGTERTLLGRKIPAMNATEVVGVEKSGQSRIIYFANGQQRKVTKTSMKQVLYSAINEQELSKALKTIRPTGKGKQVKFKIGGLKKGIIRAANSRERALTVLKERYGLESDRGTRFSKASPRQHALDAVRSHLRAQGGNK